MLPSPDGRSAPPANCCWRPARCPANICCRCFWPAFTRNIPHVQVRAAVIDSLAVLHQVEQGQVNLGLVGGKQDSDHLVFRPFARDRLVLVVPVGHAWNKRKRVSLDEFCRQPLVLREAGSGSRWCLERGADAGGPVDEGRRTSPWNWAAMRRSRRPCSAASAWRSSPIRS